jgi:C4-dicarboxylate transporter DctM subunit
LSELVIGLGLLIGLLLLIWGGMHVGVALSLLSVLGVWALKGQFGVAMQLLGLAAYDAIAHHLFGVVPLFVLMGLLVTASDVGRQSFDTAHRLFGRLRGGLGIATVAANTLFAAITGISIASAAVFTHIAVPEMLRLGYSPRFSVGVVAGSSVLGMLIPPSLLLILYGLLAETSIGDLFIAGVGPGLLLAFAFAVTIWGLARGAPGFVGRPSASPSRRLSLAATLANLAPVLGLAALVLGGIYGGVFTPNEAGAVGALAALILALAKRKLDRPRLWALLVETGHVTVSICFLLIAANVYSRALALSGLPQWLLGTVDAMGLSSGSLLATYLAALVLLGTVLDSTSILLISVPLMLPVLQALGFDLVWLGILTVLAVEIGLLTPPLGLAVYVIHSTLRDDRVSLGDIFRGAAPFALVMMAVLILVARFPALCLGLVPE